MNNTTTVQSVDRALLVLEILQENPDGLGVTKLSHELNVSKSTIHRLLMSLIQKGFVKQDKESDRYSLGLKLIELGEVVSENLDIRRLASSHLEKLAEKTGETVHLVVMENLEIVYIDKQESYATIRMFSRIGRRAPMHCTGVGKAILAFLPEDITHQVLTERPMTKFTEKTITSKKAMTSNLQQIRDRGYSIDDEEHEEGIKCAAAPILNYKGEVVAGISVASPIMRLSDEKLEMIAEETVNTSRKLSALLGAKLNNG